MKVHNLNIGNNLGATIIESIPVATLHLHLKRTWMTSSQFTFNGRRIYPFNKGLRIYGGVYHPPFDTLKIGTSTDDIKLKLYR